MGQSSYVHFSRSTEELSSAGRATSWGFQLIRRAPSEVPSSGSSRLHRDQGSSIKVVLSAEEHLPNVLEASPLRRPVYESGWRSISIHFVLLHRLLDCCAPFDRLEPSRLLLIIKPSKASANYTTNMVNLFKIQTSCGASNYFHFWLKNGENEKMVLTSYRLDDSYIRISYMVNFRPSVREHVGSSSKSTQLRWTVEARRRGL